MNTKNSKAKPASAPAAGRTAAKSESAGEKDAKKPRPHGAVEEIGGPEGPEPTRYGDWEVGGRCSDF